MTTGYNQPESNARVSSRDAQPDGQPRRPIGVDLSLSTEGRLDHAYANRREREIEIERTTYRDADGSVVVLADGWDDPDAPPHFDGIVDQVCAWIKENIRHEQGDTSDRFDDGEVVGDDMEIYVRVAPGQSREDLSLPETFAATVNSDNIGGWWDVDVHVHDPMTRDGVTLVCMEICG